MKLKKLFILGIFLALVTGLMSQPPDFTGLKIMINPGHGGNDSDDRGMPNGFWESESNLTKGLWLRDLLEDRGCEVVMSRTLNRTEDDLPLSQIAQIANENEVDLFISIHSNAGDQRTNYCMTIFNGKSETPAIPAAKVWARILWEHLLTNEATFWTSTNPHYIGDLTLNPSWTYGYGVLYPLEVPGIISEGSMHDYRPEMDRLLNLEYRKQEAWNMLYAMQEYFQLPGREVFGVIGGIIRDSLLIKDTYNIPGSPDKYEVVNKAEVEILESGEKYYVDSLNTGYYYFDSLAPGNYNLVFSAQDYFSDTVMINVLANKISYHNHWLEADKTMAPKIMNLSPAEGDTIACNDPVEIRFNMNMDSASVAEAISIEPEIKGYVSWDEDYLLAFFHPEIPYDTNTKYTLKIDTLAMHQWGVKMDSAVELSFFTGNRNRYKLENSFPADEQLEVSPFLQFRLYFEAPVNNSSLINAIFIQKENGEIISTKGATIQEIEGKGHYYFSPAEDLDFSTPYTLVINGSVKDEQNIPLVDTIRIEFTTDEDPGLLTILDEFEDLSIWSIDFVNSNGLDPSSFLYKWSKTYQSG
ncbi:MAG: Ig-like domain-containing protein, partial [Bacteroidales bacterium]